MSVVIWSEVWRLDLPRNEHYVLLALANYADDDGGKVFPSVGKIAWMCGMTERSVQRILRRLGSAGILVAVKERPGSTTVYRINIAAGKLKPPWDKSRGKSGAIRGGIADSKQGGTPDTAVSPHPRHSYVTPTPDTAMSPDPSSGTHPDPSGPKKRTRDAPNKQTSLQPAPPTGKTKTAASAGAPAAPPAPAKPSREALRKYAQQIGCKEADCVNRFMAYNESKGWKVRNWRNAFRGFWRDYGAMPASFEEVAEYGAKHGCDPDLIDRFIRYNNENGWALENWRAALRGLKRRWDSTG